MNIKNYPRVFIDFSPKIPSLKSVSNKSSLNIRYCLIAPFTFAHIYWNPLISELAYEIEEPILNEEEIEIKDRMIEAMRDLINFDSVIDKSMNSILNYIDNKFKILLIELGIFVDYESYKKIFYYLARDFIGFNEVEPLLRDYYIEDIECNGVGTPIYIVHRKYRNIKTNVKFDDVDKISGFIEKLAQRSGKYISYANPILDSTLPDGSRVNATYTQDISSRGPTFTIRKFT